MNDIPFEGLEVFSFVIPFDQGGEGVNVGFPNEASITINDPEDSKCSVLYCECIWLDLP